MSKEDKKWKELCESLIRDLAALVPIHERMAELLGEASKRLYYDHDYIGDLGLSDEISKFLEGLETKPPKKKRKK